MAIERVHLHWAVTKYKVTKAVKKHYNIVIDDQGNVFDGLWPITAQLHPIKRGKYAAHTLNANTNAVGIGLTGMLGAKERPFDAGKYPITEKQFKAAAVETAKICVEYGIEVTPKTVLTHAEVQENLGVKQRGKWDITHLPWRDDIVGAKLVGAYYRELVVEEMAPQVEGKGPPSILDVFSSFLNGWSK